MQHPLSCCMVFWLTVESWWHQIQVRKSPQNIYISSHHLYTISVLNQIHSSEPLRGNQSSDVILDESTSSMTEIDTEVLSAQKKIEFHRNAHSCRHSCRGCAEYSRYHYTNDIRSTRSKCKKSFAQRFMHHRENHNNSHFLLLKSCIPAVAVASKESCA